MIKKKEVKAPVKVAVKKTNEPIKAVAKPIIVTKEPVKPVMVCDLCKGTGKNPLEIEDVCPKCKGK